MEIKMVSRTKQIEKGVENSFNKTIEAELMAFAFSGDKRVAKESN